MTVWMDADEAKLAASVYEAIQRSSNYSTRAMQSREFRVGISDLGFCSERTRRMLKRETPEDRDMLPAWIGTALGDHAEQAICAMWPHAIRQAEVVVGLTGDRGTYQVQGHPDLIVDNLVIDVKTARGLDIARRKGPSRQQQYQRHCYALGAWTAGLLKADSLDDVKVANVFIDRAAEQREFHVHMEPYNPQIVEEAAWWLDDVIYAYVNNEEARKEPPRELCEKACGFYATCRALDTDVEGLLGEDAKVAVGLYNEGTALEREAKRLKIQAKAHLDGVTGSTGEYSVRWVHVNESEVAFTRDAYERLDIRKMK
jgi:hypothetical protein